MAVCVCVCVFVCQFIAVITRNAYGEWPVSDPRFFNIGLRPHRICSRSFRHLISSFHLSCVCLSDFRAITWEHESRNIIANLRVSLRMKNRVESEGGWGKREEMVSSLCTKLTVFCIVSSSFASFARFSFDIIMRAHSEQSQGHVLSRITARTAWTLLYVSVLNDITEADLTSVLVARRFLKGDWIQRSSPLILLVLRDCHSKDYRRLGVAPLIVLSFKTAL